jgi:hypothetical protein
VAANVLLHVHFVPGGGDNKRLRDAAGRITITATGLPTPGVPNVASYTVSGLAIEPLATTVPEPASVTLLSIGCVGLLAYGWRKQAKS